MDPAALDQLAYTLTYQMPGGAMAAVIGTLVGQFICALILLRSLR